MRRVPYIIVKDKKIKYICPKCKNEIPLDLYKLYDCCPTCEHPINRTSMGMLKVYKIIDRELYDYFISIDRR